MKITYNYTIICIALLTFIIACTKGIDLFIISTDKQILVDLYNVNPQSQDVLAWDMNEPDLSKWQGVIIDTNGKIIELELANKKIATLPTTIGNLTNLRRLVLGENKLNTIPVEIGNLANLKFLTFFNNQIHTIPSTIGNLDQLEFLSLQGNMLVTIPPEIGNLTQLANLHLEINRLETVPPEIVKLTNLTYLNLLQNNLTSLTPVICGFKRSGVDFRLDSGLCD